MSILYIVWVLFYFIGSVLPDDPNYICANGGSHIKVGIVVSLGCYVNNTGASGAGNVLIWITPVSKIKCMIILFLVLRLFWTMYTCMWVCPSHTIMCDFWMKITCKVLTLINNNTTKRTPTIK